MLPPSLRIACLSARMHGALGKMPGRYKKLLKARLVGDKSVCVLYLCRNADKASPTAGGGIDVV